MPAGHQENAAFPQLVTTFICFPSSLFSSFLLSFPTVLSLQGPP